MCKINVEMFHCGRSFQAKIYIIHKRIVQKNFRMFMVLFIYEKDIKNWRLKIAKKDDFGHILRPYRKVTCRVRTILITVIDTMIALTLNRHCVSNSKQVFRLS